ncbi:MAG TPA: LCP family protein [Chloroflexota bacterium]|nr:LCP family protein [Chloroflexota bacterium]
MSGSGENTQVGLRLIVPAITLAVPAIVLICALLSLPAPEPVAPEIEAVVSVTDVEIVAATEVAAVEEALSATIVAVVETTVPVTPLPTPQVTATPGASWVGPQTFTFVALGVDQRDDREIPRTDTIMIGKVDLRAPKVNLISIPRDLLVDIPGYGKDRINTVYVYGEQFKEPDGGIGLLRRTIEKNFGVQIDHFGLLDFQCFRTAVDALGGVTVNVPRAIVDPSYPTEDYGTRLVKFETGVQKMDGERALEYARTRSADSDFHRIQRQQLIIAAMRDQVLQLRTLPSVPTLLTGCRNMRSDLGWRDYLNLASSLQTLNSNRVAFAAIDEKLVVDTTLSTGAAVLVPRWDPIHTLVSESFGTGAPSATTRTGAVASPTPSLPWASPSPSPFPSPFPIDGSVAGPSRIEPLPDDPPAIAVPAPPASRRT